MPWNKSINFITPSIWIKKFSTTVLTSLVSPKFVMNSIEESWQHGLHHPERRVHFFQYTHHRIMSLNIFNGLHQGLAGVVSRTLGLLATEVWLKSDGAIGWYNLCINITGSYNGIVPYTTIWNVTLLVSVCLKVISTVLNHCVLTSQMYWDIARQKRELAHVERNMNGNVTMVSVSL